MKQFTDRSAGLLRYIILVVALVLPYDLATAYPGAYGVFNLPAELVTWGQHGWNVQVLRPGNLGTLLLTLIPALFLLNGGNLQPQQFFSYGQKLYTFRDTPNSFFLEGLRLIGACWITGLILNFGLACFVMPNAVPFPTGLFSDPIAFLAATRVLQGHLLMTTLMPAIAGAIGCNLLLFPWIGRRILKVRIKSGWWPNRNKVCVVTPAMLKAASDTSPLFSPVTYQLMAPSGVADVDGNVPW